MRFASLESGGTSDYAAAGKAVADSAAKTFAVQRKSGPDYGMLSQVAMKTNSNEKVAAIKASAKVTKAGIDAYSDVTTTGHKVDVFNTKQDIKASQRKAGGLAAIGKMAGAGFLAATDNTKGRERPTADIQGLYDKYKTDRDALKARQTAEFDAHGSYSQPEYKPYAGATPSGGATPGKVTGGNNSGSQGLSGTNLSGDLFDMSKLTSKDYGDLAFAVSSEAQLGTDDEFGVAANILTRLKSGNYGSSVNSIIHAPGQYEGVYKGMSVASPNIAARFQSPEGQKKLQEAMQRLDGRTEFKGQTMLQNRVASEDPMFSSGGNFYHYAGQ
jgi:hypothetical protein